MCTPWRYDKCQMVGAPHRVICFICHYLTDCQHARLSCVNKRFTYLFTYLLKTTEGAILMAIKIFFIFFQFLGPSSTIAMHVFALLPTQKSIFQSSHFIAIYVLAQKSAIKPQSLNSNIHILNAFSCSSRS